MRVKITIQSKELSRAAHCGPDAPEHKGLLEYELVPGDKA